MEIIRQRPNRYGVMETVSDPTSEFDTLINTWNRLPNVVRREIHDHCVWYGHDWHPVMDEGVQKRIMCVNCTEFWRDK